MKTTYHRGPASRAATQGFRLFLPVELGRRCDRNPRSSLRAFADYLGLDHATRSPRWRRSRRNRLDWGATS